MKARRLVRILSPLALGSMMVLAAGCGDDTTIAPRPDLAAGEGADMATPTTPPDLALRDMAGTTGDDGGSGSDDLGPDGGGGPIGPCIGQADGTPCNDNNA